MIELWISTLLQDIGLQWLKFVFVDFDDPTNAYLFLLLNKVDEVDDDDQGNNNDKSNDEDEDTRGGGRYSDDNNINNNNIRWSDR